MASEEEFREALIWAENITRKKQKETQTKANVIDNIRFALYLLGIIAFVLILSYIIYRAYKVPDPPSILQEVNKMLNQTKPK